MNEKEINGEIKSLKEFSHKHMGYAKSAAGCAAFFLILLFVIPKIHTPRCADEFYFILSLAIGAMLGSSASLFVQALYEQSKAKKLSKSHTK